MTVAASIQFTQGSNVGAVGQALFGVTGTPVVVANGNNANIGVWTFAVIDAPPGSTVPIGLVQTGSSPTWTFTPDLSGGYEIQLVVTSNDGMNTQATDFRVFGIVLPSGRFIPPFTATNTALNFSAQTRGWAPHMEAWLHHLDGLTGVAAPLFYTPLRASAPTGSQDIRFVPGFAESGDGGGGEFIWNSTDTRADDNGTIIQVTGMSTGRWNRIYSGHLDIRWFGADATGTTDSTAAIQSALNLAGATGSVSTRRVYAPTGLYLFSSLITIPAYVEFYGDPSSYFGPGAYNAGMFGTVFRWTGGTGAANAMQFQIFTGISQGIYCHDFILHGNFGLSGGIANSVTGLLIAGAPGKELTACKIDRVTIAEFNICCQWGNDGGAGDSQADSIQWEHCHFSYANTAGMVINSANAADASEMKNCFWTGNILGSETNTIGLHIQICGLFKLIHCQGDSINTWVQFAPGNPFTLENCEDEQCNYFLICPTGADDDHPLFLVNNTINGGLSIGATMRVVAISNNITGWNFNNSVNIGLVLGASTRWIGRGNRFVLPCQVTMSASTIFDEQDVPHAGGVYDQEWHTQGQTMSRPGPAYGLGGTVDALAYQDLCTRSGFQGIPWAASTFTTVADVSIAIPDNGHAFYCESTTGPATKGSSQPTWNIGKTTIAAPSIGLTLPQGTINVASTAGFLSSGTIWVGTSLGNQLITYTGLGGGGTTFTGCTGGTGVMSSAFTIYAATADGDVSWADLGPSSLHELTGVPGQFRLDGDAPFVLQQGTEQWYRTTVAPGAALGRVAIRNTTGVTSADVRPFGVIWGDGVGSMPFPLSGSAVDSFPLAFGQHNVAVGSGTTYDLTAADAAKPFITFTGTPSGTCSVIFPAGIGSDVAFYRIFNDTSQTLTLEAVGGGVSNVTLLAGCTATIAVAATLVLNADSALASINGSPGVLSFYSAAPVAQATRVGQLTDSSGGSIGTTINAMTGTYASDFGTINANNASLINKINKLETIIHNLGLST